MKYYFLALVLALTACQSSTVGFSAVTTGQTAIASDLSTLIVVADSSGYVIVRTVDGEIPVWVRSFEKSGIWLWSGDQSIFFERTAVLPLELKPLFEQLFTDAELSQLNLQFAESTIL